MARSPRLTRRFGEQRAALGLSAVALSDVGKKIRALCSAEALPEPDHRTRLAPHPEDDRGVDLLVDVGRVRSAGRGSRGVESPSAVTYRWVRARESTRGAVTRSGSVDDNVGRVTAEVVPVDVQGSQVLCGYLFPGRRGNASRRSASTMPQSIDLFVRGP